MDNIFENTKVIESDIEEIENKCNQINCNPVYETIKAFMKLFIDLFKCCKPKIINLEFKIILKEILKNILKELFSIYTI